MAPPSQQKYDSGVHRVLNISCRLEFKEAATLCVIADLPKHPDNIKIRSPKHFFDNLFNYLKNNAVPQLNLLLESTSMLIGNFSDCSRLCKMADNPKTKYV